MLLLHHREDFFDRGSVLWADSEHGMDVLRSPGVHVQFLPGCVLVESGISLFGRIPRQVVVPDTVANNPECPHINGCSVDLRGPCGENDLRGLVRWRPDAAIQHQHASLVPLLCRLEVRELDNVPLSLWIHEDEKVLQLDVEVCVARAMTMLDSQHHLLDEVHTDRLVVRRGVVEAAHGL